MKYCHNCRREYPDGSLYCANCGKPLQTRQETRKNSINKIFPICAIAIIIFFVGYSLSSLKTSRETLANAKNEKWLQQYYQDIEEKATYPDEWDLSIVDSEKEYSGGSYGHITGTVRNITEDKTISSFKVVVKLEDHSGQIIGTDYDFFYGTLGPGEETDFDIMYEKPSRTVSDYSLQIEEVS
ncbi:FxLYD domain-containing protein [uncultured Ruthenibacterium sp.]|uniref:FxLYD domain-containing protein n=1 Tax=uncultured Ruthenibacterium sp. TaxID=1905347 RepID=UPI00349E7B6D